MIALAIALTSLLGIAWGFYAIERAWDRKQLVLRQLRLVRWYTQASRRRMPR